MANLEALSDADLEAYAAGNLDAMSDQGLAMLSGEAPTQETDPRANLRSAWEGMGFSPGAAEFVADNPVTNMVLGFGKQADSTIRGVKQVLSDNPEELKRLAAEEENARKAYEKLDEGIGVEDAGEALFFASQLALGSGFGAALKAAPTAVAKIGGNILTKLSTTTPGVAVMAALDESLKGRTLDESRAEEALWAGGTTAAFGGIAGPAAKVFTSKGANVLASVLTGTGIERTLGGQFGRSSAGIVARSLREKLLGSAQKRLAEDLIRKQRSAVRAGGSSAASVLAAAARADASAASTAGLGTVSDRGFNKLWDFVDKNYLRTAPTKAFPKGRPLAQTKLAKELGIDRAAKAQALNGLLLQGSMDVTKDQSGNLISVLNPQKLAQNWQTVVNDPEMAVVFKNKKHMAALEDFVMGLVKNPDPTAQLTGGQIAQRYTQRIFEETSKTVKALEDIDLPADEKNRLRQSLAGPFMAYVGQQLNAQGADWEDIGNAFSEAGEGLFGWMNYDRTLGEYIQEFEEQK